MGYGPFTGLHRVSRNGIQGNRSRMKHEARKKEFKIFCQLSLRQVNREAQMLHLLHAKIYDYVFGHRFTHHFGNRLGMLVYSYQNVIYVWIHRQTAMVAAAVAAVAISFYSIRSKKLRWRGKQRDRRRSQNAKSSGKTKQNTDGKRIDWKWNEMKRN